MLLRWEKLEHMQFDGASKASSTVHSHYLQSNKSLPSSTYILNDLGTCCVWTTEPQYLGNQITTAVKSLPRLWLCQQCPLPPPPFSLPGHKLVHTCSQVPTHMWKTMHEDSHSHAAIISRCNNVWKTIFSSFNVLWLVRDGLGEEPLVIVFTRNHLLELQKVENFFSLPEYRCDMAVKVGNPSKETTCLSELWLWGCKQIHLKSESEPSSIILCSSIPRHTLLLTNRTQMYSKGPQLINNLVIFCVGFSLRLILICTRVCLKACSASFGELKMKMSQITYDSSRVSANQAHGECAHNQTHPKLQSNVNANKANTHKFTHLP